MSGYKYNLAHAATLDGILFNQNGGTTVTNYKQGTTDLGALYAIRTFGYKKYFKLSESTTLNECNYKKNGTPLTELLQSDTSNYFTLTGTYVNDIINANTETNKYNYVYKFTGDGTQATTATTSVAQAVSGSITFINNTRVRIVAIGGGGGGGNYQGGGGAISEGSGGGGAGGMLDVIVDCRAGVTYTICIGNGGSRNLSNNTAQSGFPTFISSSNVSVVLIAPGGGYGGNKSAVTGGNGGCGGGGCGYGATYYGGTVTALTVAGYASVTAHFVKYDISSISNVTIGSLTTTGTSDLVTPSGYNGGYAVKYSSGGGGGGIGGAGGDVPTFNQKSDGGDGGIGKTIFNTNVGGGGGGGAGTDNDPAVSTAGTGTFGGGNGIYYGTTAEHDAANGHPNTGGGGGGSPNSPNTYGGAGGTGVCWICF